MIRVALIRHGVTAWNLEKRIQGQIDLPLCDSGRRQLQALVLPEPYTACRWYCSPLRRALQSAELLGIEDCKVEPDLIEMSWGDWEGKVLKQLRQELGDEMRANENRGVDFCAPGGESPRAVQARLQNWLLRVAARGEDCGAVVHKGIIRCLYAMARGWDMRGESPIDFDWSAIHQFELASNGTLTDSYYSIPLLNKF